MIGVNFILYSWFRSYFLYFIVWGEIMGQPVCFVTGDNCAIKYMLPGEETPKYLSSHERYFREVWKIFGYRVLDFYNVLVLFLYIGNCDFSEVLMGQLPWEIGYSILAGVTPASRSLVSSFDGFNWPPPQIVSYTASKKLI